MREDTLRRRGWTGAAALLALFVLAGNAAIRGARPAQAAESAGRGEARDITEYITKLSDLQARMRITQMDAKELEKIGKDFSMTYQIRNVTLQYKQPDKLRLSGKIHLLGEAQLIVNGTTRFYSVPRLPKKIEDLERSPAKRLSLLEYGGLLSPETLRFMQGRFLREESVDGEKRLVFDMTYQGGAASHYRLWIDPETRIVCKREWLDGDDQLKATFLYSEPREVGEGVWLPTRIEVRNAEGATAATSTLESVKVNQGLSDDLFAIRL